MGNDKWGINSEKQNSHSINNNFQLNSNFHNYFNSPLFLHFFKHSFSSKPYLPFPSSFNSNFHLFPFLIVLVVYCYCCPILNNITLLYQMNQCDWYALFHTPQTNTLKTSVVFIQTRSVSIIHTEWYIIPESYSSFGFNNCLREGKEPTTEQPCHVEQWPLLRNKWINPPFSHIQQTLKSFLFS